MLEDYKLQPGDVVQFRGGVSYRGSIVMKHSGTDGNPITYKGEGWGTGKALIDNKMAGTKLWSKAGWTSRSRHDAAYIETPDGQKLVIVVFTENHADDRETIAGIAARVLKALKESRS